MIRTMGVALRSLDRGPIAHPRPDRIHPSFADFQSVSGSKISNLYSRELFAFTEISQGAKRGFFATGCRVGEVYRLNRQDWDGYHQAILVLGKGNKEREVYLGSKARIWLHRYLTERQDHDPALFVTERGAHRISIHGIQQTFKRIASRCGLAQKVHPHVLRHTLATTLLNQGAPLVAVQSILGHEKPETTQLYAVLSGEARHHAYQRYFVQ